MSTRPHPQHEALKAALLRGLSEGGNRNRILVSGNHGYVAFSGEQGGAQWLAQVSAGRQLPKGLRLTPEQSQVLSDAGLAQLRASQNFRRRFQANDDEIDAWCHKALAIMARVFSVTEVEIKIRLESVPELNEKPLADAMDLVAKKRTWSARSGLYMILARSRLVLAVANQPLNGNLSDAQLHTDGELGGRPVAAVFSSYEALDTYEPRGLNALTVSGIELFPWLVEQKVGSVLVNPRNAPRGELYANELLMLRDGIRRMMH